MYLVVQPESGHTMDGVIEQLHAGEPPVAVNGGDDPAHPAAIRFDVRVCEDWEIEAIGRRLHEIFGS